MRRAVRKVAKDVSMTRFEDGRMVHETRIQESRIPAEPDFVKMYTEDIANLNHIKGHKRDVLAFMASVMDYNNVAVVSPPMRRRWASELGVSMSTINNAVSALKKEGHILSDGHGEYTVNPSLFAKGEWKNTVKRRESYDAAFIVSYVLGESGYTRTYRKAILTAAARGQGHSADSEDLGALG